MNGAAAAARLRALVLRVAKAIGLFGLSRHLTRRRLRILCYHGVWLGGAPHYGDCLFMSPERFARRIELVARLGYPVLALDEAVERLARDDLPAGALVITIDDGWYSSFARMMPVLKRHGMPATLYVTSYYALAGRPVLNVLLGYMLARCDRLPKPAELPAEAAALLPAGRPPSAEEQARIAAALAAHLDELPSLEARWQALQPIAAAFAFDLDEVLADRRFDLMNADEIRHACADGFDIQLHTHSHRMHDFDRSSLCEEVHRNRDALVQVLGTAPESLRHFCYPSGVFHESVFETLRGLGIRSATTTEFGLNERGAEPLALRRILDCESLSDIELEARLCGLWSFLSGARHRLSRLAGGR
jgi:peptidoglycan/xylan/chitin deacetylase (PgdA/CDA1 family)